MPNQRNPKLTIANNLKESGKYKEALELLNKIENTSDLGVDELFNFYLLQSFLFYQLHFYNKALEAADWVFRKSEEIGIDFILLDASIARGKALYRLGRNDACYESILKCEELIANINDQPEEIIGKRNEELSYIKGIYYWQIGDFDKALEQFEINLVLGQKFGTKQEISRAFHNIGLIHIEKGEFAKGLEKTEKSLEIDKELNDKIGISLSYNNIGEIYRIQGELDLGLDFYELSLSIAKESKDTIVMAFLLMNIGLILYEKGELDKALNSLQKGHQLFKETSITFETSRSLFYMIQIYFDQNNLESARNVLDEIKYLSEMEDNKRIYHRFQIAKALKLKKSGSTRNIIKAGIILNELLEEKSIENELLIIILLNLCDLSLRELKASNDLEILEEIPDFISNLLEIAKKENSFLLLAEIYLFKAKISLINLELDETQQLLTKAQNIAQKYNLTKLAMKISLEHDQLIENLDKWREFKRKNVPISERLKKSFLESDLNRILRKQQVEQVEIHPEEPLLISIISKEGLSVFHHFFLEDWKEKELFNSFITGFNAFGDEMFSNAFDRIKIGDNTILINSIGKCSVCYAIKGQSYHAQQKLTKFSEAIKNSSEIKGALIESLRSGAVLNKKKLPHLGDLVINIFKLDKK